MYCTNCGKEITNNQPFCPHCGQNLTPLNIAPDLQSQKKNKGCVIGIAFIIILFIGGIGSAISNAAKLTANEKTGTNNDTINTPASNFEKDCGIEASAHVKSNGFINHPELTITVKNVSGKDIAAIQFLAVPYDVYGEEIKSFASQENLYTDDIIRAGAQKQIHYGPFLLSNIKSVKLYVYSIYYTDGTYWGNKNASRSHILKNAKRIEATFEQ